MAPTPLTARDEMMGAAPAPGTPDSNYTPWLIVLIVLGVLIAMSLGAYVAFDWRRRSQRNATAAAAAAAAEKPFLAPSGGSLHQGRRRKLSQAERIMEEEETQRSTMIRKSLASRGSRANSEVVVQITPAADEHDHDHDHDGSGSGSDSEADDRDVAETRSQGGRSRGASLREDWKAWEADIRRERSNSGERHPYDAAAVAAAAAAAATTTTGGIHPAMAGRNDLPPPPFESVSPSRTPLLGGPPSPPLPSLPTFAHTK